MKLIIVYLCFIFLYTTAQNTGPRYFKKSDVPKYFLYIKKKFKSKENANLFFAYTTGLTKKKLSRRTKRNHRTFFLNHLFTPSGLHLSSFLSFILIFKKLSFLKYFVFILPFFLNGFYSLKRIGGIQIINSIFSVKRFYIFLFVFLFDYIFGSYRHSPLSFTYSFLFLGCFYSVDKKIIEILQLKRIIISIIFAQVLLCFLTGNFINPINTFLGFLLSSLFSLFFPILVLTLLFPFFPLISISEFLISFFNFLINIDTSFNFDLWPILPVTLGTFILLFYKNKIYFWSILFLISSFPILNHEKVVFRNRHKKPDYGKDLLEEHMTRIKRTSRGYKIWYKNNLYCYRRLYYFNYLRRCKIN